MKVLILNPKWHPEHPTVRALADRGVTALTASTPEEAWLLLQMQGATVDLCVVSRELQRPRTTPPTTAPGVPSAVNERGLGFVAQVRRFGRGRRIPVLLTSEVWRNVDFLAHSRGPARADAYVALPCTDAELFEAIRPFLSGDADLDDVSREVAPDSATGTVEAAPPAAQPPLAQPVPSITADSSDYDVLRMYLMLREKDVVSLTSRVRDLDREIVDLKQSLRRERFRSVELEYRLEQEQRRASDLARENRRLLDSVRDERDLVQYRRKLGSGAESRAFSETAPQRPDSDRSDGDAIVDPDDFFAPNRGKSRES